MMRLRLKADGRIVQILPDGSEGTLPSPLAEIAQQMRYGRPLGGWIAAARAARPDAAYARDGPQLGAGQAFPARARPCPAQGDRGGSGRGVRNPCRREGAVSAGSRAV